MNIGLRPCPWPRIGREGYRARIVPLARPLARSSVPFVHARLGCSRVYEIRGVTADSEIEVAASRFMGRVSFSLSLVPFLPPGLRLPRVSLPRIKARAHRTRTCACIPPLPQHHEFSCTVTQKEWFC